MSDTAAKTMDLVEARKRAAASLVEIVERYASMAMSSSENSQGCAKVAIAAGEAIAALAGEAKELQPFPSPR